jgi:putative acyl-CoA dehydrogenase
MRQAVKSATFHARHRSAFKSKLIEKPAMRHVLADIGIESEAAIRMVRLGCASVRRRGSGRKHCMLGC